MAAINQEKKAKPNTRDQARVRPGVLTGADHELSDLLNLPTGLVGGRNGSIQKQAALLGDARLHTAQRRALAVQVGQVQGSQHLQRVVALAEEETERASSRQKATELPAGPALTRNEATLSTPAQAPRCIIQRVEIGPYNPQTYDDLINVGVELVDRLCGAVEGLDQQEPVRIRADEWIRGVQASWDWMAQHLDEPISPATATQARRNYQEMLDIETAIRNLAVVRMRAAERALRAERRRAGIMQGIIDDSLRTAFRRGEEESLLAQLWSLSTNALSIHVGLGDLCQMARESVASMLGTEAPRPGPIMRMLSTLNVVIAAQQTVVSVASLEEPTDMNTALDQLNNITGLASSLSTLFGLIGLSAHFGLYLTAYVVPMTQAVTQRLRQWRAMRLHQISRLRVATGELPGAELMEHEEGGVNMFNFMVLTMWAESPARVPHPDQVAEHLRSRRGRIEAAAGSAMPTGTAARRAWVFEHRQLLWAMHYGSMPVPVRPQRAD